MRHILPGLAFSLALALVASSLLAAPQTPLASMPLRAYAVNLNLNYSDPASDVFILYTSNSSHVTDAVGNWLYSNTEPQVNILRIFSVDASSDVGVYLRVQGGSAISYLANTSYELHLFTRSDNSTSYLLRYSNGTTTLRTNHTGSPVYDLTSNTTISPANQLGITVSKSNLGNITAWNMDATAKMVGANYTFQDFGWLQPGNPGSAPAFIQGRVTDAANGDGLANANVSTGAGGYFTTTNATGYYSLPLAPGTFNVTFSLSGYDSQTKQVTIQNEQTLTVNAALSKTSAVPSYLVWIVVAVVLVAAALIAFLVLRRRKASPPKRAGEEPSPRGGKP